MNAHSLQGLEQALGYDFTRRELIVEALTHRSHFHEHQDSLHNERLEFLGDAVLNLCVALELMQACPAGDEGQLSRLRSTYVSRAALAAMARDLNLGSYIRLGRGEDLSGGRERDSLLSDAMEAVIAAIYLDGGMLPVRRLLTRFLGIDTAIAADEGGPLTADFKSRLQEFCQSHDMGTPSYVCLETSGPDHQRSFTMALMLQGLEIHRAAGSTKKEATLRAAREVIEAHEGPELLKFLLSKGAKTGAGAAVTETQS